jgi:hypothetical protein
MNICLKASFDQSNPAAVKKLQEAQEAIQKSKGEAELISAELQMYQSFQHELNTLRERRMMLPFDYVSAGCFAAHFFIDQPDLTIKKEGKTLYKRLINCKVTQKPCILLALSKAGYEEARNA